MQSPIDSAIRCALGYGSSLTMYPLDIFLSYEKMASVRCCAAIIHGLDDGVVPPRCGRALHALSSDPFEPCWLEGYGHNDMPYDPVFMYAISFLAFLKRREGATPET